MYALMDHLSLNFIQNDKFPKLKKVSLSDSTLQSIDRRCIDIVKKNELSAFVLKNSEINYRRVLSNMKQENHISAGVFKIHEVRTRYLNEKIVSNINLVDDLICASLITKFKIIDEINILSVKKKYHLTYIIISLKEGSNLLLTQQNLKFRRTNILILDIKI